MGRVAPQYDELLGKTLKGSADKILVRPDAPVAQWGKTVTTKSGKKMTIEEFIKKFPHELGN